MGGGGEREIKQDAEYADGKINVCAGDSNSSYTPNLLVRNSNPNLTPNPLSKNKNKLTINPNRNT